MKKIILLLITVLLLTSCSSQNLSNYDKIQKNLVNMNGYSCEAKVKYISNKSENEYSILQSAKDSGEYSIKTIMPKEVEGNYIIYDGKMIWQYNPRLDSKISIDVPDKAERKQILLFTFMENYMKNKDSTVETGSFDDSKCTVLEADILESNKFFAKEKLWIDNESLAPVKLVIYDEDDNERVIVTFDKFEYNPNFDEKIFNLKSVIG